MQEGEGAEGDRSHVQVNDPQDHQGLEDDLEAQGIPPPPVSHLQGEAHSLHQLLMKRLKSPPKTWSGVMRRSSQWSQSWTGGQTELMPRITRRLLTASGTWTATKGWPMSWCRRLSQHWERSPPWCLWSKGSRSIPKSTLRSWRGKLNHGWTVWEHLISSCRMMLQPTPASSPNHGANNSCMTSWPRRNGLHPHRTWIPWIIPFRE